MYRQGPSRSSNTIIIREIESKKRNYFYEISLILVGAIVGAIAGVFSSQLFYRSNIKFEKELLMKTEIMKEQFFHLNRLLTFSLKYQAMVSMISNQQISGTIVEYIDKKTGKLIESELLDFDTSIVCQKKIPSFIVRENVRSDFLKDIELIKENNEFINIGLYKHFFQILTFIQNNPLPNTFNLDKFAYESNWWDDKTLKRWNDLMNELTTKCIIELQKYYSDKESLFKFFDIKNP